MRHGHWMTGVGAFVLALGTTAAARADDLRVPEEFRTIQEAVDAASPGDRVLVGPGRYRETVSITTDDLTIEGDGATLQSRRGEGGLFVYADGITVSNFLMRRVSVYSEGDGNRFEQVEVQRPRIEFGLSVSGADSVVRDCTVQRVRGPKSADLWLAGIHVEGDRSLVSGNRVTDALRIDAVRVTGDDVVVEDNVIDYVAAGAGIMVAGEGFRISGNVLTNVGRTAPTEFRPFGIIADPGMGGGGLVRGRPFVMQRSCPGIWVDLDSSGGVVTANSVEHWASEAFNCNVHSTTINGNEARLRGVDGIAFLVDGSEIEFRGNVAIGGRIDITRGFTFNTGLNFGPNTVEENTIRDESSAGPALFIYGNGNQVSRNVVEGFDHLGLTIEGNANHVTENTISGGLTAGGAGMYIGDGATNLLQDNHISGGAGSGFLFSGESRDNVMEHCTAADNAECGLDQAGNRNEVTDSTFTGSGILDVRNTGTLDLFEGNLFHTGGPNVR
jgi:hypothetical protein